MKVLIRGVKVKVTPSIEAYVKKKLERLDKFFYDSVNIEARVLIKIKGHEQIIEITIPLKNFILRSEENHSDLYAAVDLAVDKLERQLTKNRAKMKHKRFKGLATMIIGTDDDKEVEPERIVRRKVIEMKPMSEEEAILQLNMIGHDFFVYKDDEAGQIRVLYKRKDGNYGVILTN